MPKLKLGSGFLVLFDFFLQGKGGILDFYRTRVQHFYDARVEQADYKFAGHLAQSIINQMIRAQIQRHSYELLNYSIPLSGPMSLLTAAFFDVRSTLFFHFWK